MGRIGTADLEDLVVEAQSASSNGSTAMNEILRRFEPLAQKVARGLTNCPHTQADFANEARLALVRAVRRHELGTPGFPAYAKLFMRGAALRAWRKVKAHNRIEVSTAPDEYPETAAARPEHHALNEHTPWDTPAVAAAVEAAHPAHRDLLILRYAEDWPMAEVADVMGTTVSAVSQRLATARRSVKRQLVSAAA